MEQEKKDLLEETISVKEFADITGRFPNQIYELINHGSRYRKLNTTTINGKIRVYRSEIDGFPFTAADKLRIELAGKINDLDERLKQLEE